MNKNLQILLRLDGLVLTRKGLELSGNLVRRGGLGDLDKKIEKLRRRLPPAVLSHYDGLTRKYINPLSLLTGGCVKVAKIRFPNESPGWLVGHQTSSIASIAADSFLRALMSPIL